MTRAAILILISAFSLVACGDDSNTDGYDPTWGDDVSLPTGKGDFLDLAPVIEFGTEATGSVDSQQLDLYKIELFSGDRIRITKRVTDGDLKPDFTLFQNTATALRSDNYDVADGRLVKEYTIGAQSNHLIAVRAYRNQGAGKYGLLIECLGGPCAGEFPEPEPEEIETSDIVGCIDSARVCSFNALPGYNGRVGNTRAGTIFVDCLAAESTWDGKSCESMCDASEDARALCDEIITTLPFYADQPSTCIDRLDTCMSECTDYHDYGSDDEVWNSELAMCWTNGFNGTCNGFARRMSECGGEVSNDTAVCYEQCWASDGVFLDDLDVICEETCGACGVECQRQIDGEYFVTLPTDGMVGDIEEVFIGEVDPAAVGDACLTFIRVWRAGDGEFAPGLYGLVESMDGCEGDRWRYDEGKSVHVAAGDLEAITDADQLHALNRYQEATYMTLSGDIDELDLY